MAKKAESESDRKKRFRRGREVTLNVYVPTASKKALDVFIASLSGSKILLETGGKINQQQIVASLMLWAVQEMDKNGVPWAEKELAPHLQFVALEIAKAERKAKIEANLKESVVRKSGDDLFSKETTDD